MNEYLEYLEHWLGNATKKFVLHNQLRNLEETESMREYHAINMNICEGERIAFSRARDFVKELMGREAK